MKNKLAAFGLAGILLAGGCASTGKGIKTASEGIDKPATVATEAVKTPDEIVNEYDNSIKGLFNQYAPEQKKEEEKPYRVPPEGL